MMKVIDFHVHVGTKGQWTPTVVDYFQLRNPQYWQDFGDKITPEKVIAFLKAQGVSHAVLLAEYAPQATGIITNEVIADFCAGHEELIPIGGLDFKSNIPLLQQADHAVRKLGVKGFKMLPSYAHFYPDDQRLFPFYDYVQSTGLPVMFHTGTSIFCGTKIKYADPLLLDEVAEEFPRLKITMEHGGRSFWYDKAYWLLTRHKNLYIGIAGIPVRPLLTHFPHLERYPDRFIFGSDWPGVTDIKLLIEKVQGLAISNETKEMILWKNGANLLGL
jgi:hypothetical protein